MATLTGDAALGTPSMIGRTGSADVPEPSVPALRWRELSWQDCLTLAYDAGRYATGQDGRP